MKIRSGFVSNSSTSSFCIIIPVENHEEIVSRLSDYGQKVIRALQRAGNFQLKEKNGQPYYGVLAMGSNAGGDPIPNSFRQTMASIANPIVTERTRFDCGHTHSKEDKFCSQCGRVLIEEHPKYDAHAVWGSYVDDCRELTKTNADVFVIEGWFD